MKWIVHIIIFFSGCASRPPRVNFNTPSFSSLDPGDIVHNWGNYASYAGGMLIFFAIICCVWVKDKSIAVRLFANGFLFILVAKLMNFIGDNMGWVLLACLITYIVFNAPRVEKMLMKIGIRVDINRDGEYGTTSMHKQQDAIETEKIDKSA